MKTEKPTQTHEYMSQKYIYSARFTELSFLEFWKQNSYCKRKHLKPFLVKSIEKALSLKKHLQLQPNTNIQGRIRMTIVTAGKNKKASVASQKGPNVCKHHLLVEGCLNISWPGVLAGGFLKWLIFIIN